MYMHAQAMLLLKSANFRGHNSIKLVPLSPILAISYIIILYVYNILWRKYLVG